MGRALVLVFLLLALAMPGAANADNPTHVVAYGETLYSIARAYGVSTQALADANGITTESWVYAGQTLDIPVESESSGATSSGPVTVAQVSPGGVYIVRAGDTLSSVSRDFNVSIAAIADANNIPPNGFLYTGWQLKIPGVSSPNAKPANSAPAASSANESAGEAPKTTTSYIVQPGDTLYGIAVEHNVTMAALRIANNLGTPYVFSGQRLIIPNSASASAPAKEAAATKSAANNAPANDAAANNTTANDAATKDNAANSVSIADGLLASVDNFPIYRQEQTLTCEQSAASMATRGQLTEAQIVAAMPRSDNPFEGIRGETNYELLGGLTHYGTYAQGLQKGLAKLGHQSTTYYGQSYAQFKASILENLRAGRPVIWWTTWHETFQETQWVQVSNGTKVPLTPYEHAVLIVKATDTGVTYHDPYDGTVRFTSWADHERTSGYFNNMALVVY